MNWTEICVKIKTENTTVAADICNMADTGGIYIEDYSDLEQGAWDIAHIDLIDEDLTKKDRNHSVIHMYISEESNFKEVQQYVSERLRFVGIDFELSLQGVDDSDWAENWKKFFKVTPIGERLIICPVWEKYENKDNKTVLKIDPGAAFGTGTHATTYLCLQLLEKYVKNGMRVLDIGCGSGILGICSVLLGAEKCDGVDIDPTAVKVAKENAQINGVVEKSNFICGDLADKIDGRYNIVCANIVADIIMRLNKDIKNYMQDGALYFTSGIIDVRVDEVRKSFNDCGLKIVEELKKDNWYAFVLSK